jgi:hypothetical protein
MNWRNDVWLFFEWNNRNQIHFQPEWEWHVLLNQNVNPMKYQIRPFIYNTDTDLVIFFTELHQMSTNEIQDGIDSCTKAMKGLVF